MNIGTRRLSGWRRICFVAAKFQLDPEADEEVGALYPELEEGETDEERAERLRYQRFLVPIIF